jgi:protein-disulfide isomerase
MPSGKQSKRRRRDAQQVPAPPGKRRQASTKVLLGAGGVIALVVVAVVLAVVLTRGSGSSSSSTSSVSATPLPEASAVEQQFNGIPQQGNVLGSPSAPATMVEYIDLQCPYCAQFETQTMPTLISRYVRPGKLKVEARIIAFIGPNSSFGRKAAVAAGEQDKLFNFAQLLYLNQGQENTGWLNDAMVKSAAVSITGLDAAKLLADQNSAAVDNKASNFDQQKTADNVQVTPTILVGKSGGTLSHVEISSPADVASVEKAINAALGQ